MLLHTGQLRLHARLVDERLELRVLFNLGNTEHHALLDRKFSLGALRNLLRLGATLTLFLHFEAQAGLLDWAVVGCLGTLHKERLRRFIVARSVFTIYEVLRVVVVDELCNLPLKYILSFICLTDWLLVH